MKRITFELPPPLYKELKVHCVCNGLTMKNFIVKALSWQLEQKPQKPQNDPMKDSLDEVFGCEN